jgi:hypothetical protein
MAKEYKIEFDETEYDNNIKNIIESRNKLGWEFVQALKLETTWQLIFRKKKKLLLD